MWNAVDAKSFPQLLKNIFLKKSTQFRSEAHKIVVLSSKSQANAKKQDIHIVEKQKNKHTYTDKNPIDVFV